VDTLLQIGLSNALVATILAAFVACVGRVYRRPALVHTLWLLVLLKLITPAPLALPISWPAGMVAATSGGSRIDDGGSNIAGFSAFVDLRSTIFDPQSSILTLWLAGSALWFALAAVRSYRFGRLLRFGRPAPLALQYQAEYLAEDLGLGRCPVVWLMPGILSPMLWGLGRRAKLLLPADLIDRLDAEQLRTLLAHELAHARRRDPWVRILELSVLGMYWWHPVAWWARRRLREAEEQCCDAWVVWALPAAAPSYATALVETVAFLSAARPALPPVASGVSYVGVLKGRLTLILCGTTPKGISVSGLFAVLALGLVLLPWRPVLGQPEPADAPLADHETIKAERERVQPEVELLVPPVETPQARADAKKETGKDAGQRRRTDRGPFANGGPGRRPPGPPRPGDMGPGRRGGPGPPGPRPGFRDGPPGRGDFARPKMDRKGMNRHGGGLDEVEMERLQGDAA
jgi:beta-lactamase regulating signal transducer with metallopeptidase domain